MGRGLGVRTAANDPKRAGAALLTVFTRESAPCNELRRMSERAADDDHIGNALR
jgi:hypothetical protein